MGEMIERCDGGGAGEQVFNAALDGAEDEGRVDDVLGHVEGAAGVGVLHGARHAVAVRQPRGSMVSGLQAPSAAALP